MSGEPRKKHLGALNLGILKLKRRKTVSQKAADVKEFIKGVSKASKGIQRRQERIKKRSPGDPLGSATLQHFSLPTVQDIQGEFQIPECEDDSMLFALSQYIGDAANVPGQDCDEGVQFRADGARLPRDFLLDAIHSAASKHSLFTHSLLGRSVVRADCPSPADRKQSRLGEEASKDAQQRISRAIKKTATLFATQSNTEIDFEAVKEAVLEEDETLSPVKAYEFDGANEFGADALWTMDGSALLAFGCAAEAFIERMLYFIGGSGGGEGEREYSDASDVAIDSEDSWIEGDDVHSDSSY